MADIPQAVIDTLIAEAAGEGPEGMRRVAETILNRAAIRGLSPEQVVTQRDQYTGYSNPGPAARRAQNNAETRAAAEAAFQLAMQPGDPTGGADHYYAPGTISQPRWASSMTPTGEYGGHAFFSSRPIPPGEIPNVVASLTDTVPPRPPTPVTMTPDLSLLRNPQMSAEARQAQVTPLRPAQTGAARGSALADSLGRNPIPGGKQTSPMFDAAYDTRTGQMRMMPAPMATAGMAFAATPAPAPIPAQQSPQMAGLRSRDQGLQAALDQRYPQQATQYPPMRLPEIPPSNLGQPPVTRSVPSIPMKMAPTQAEIDRAPGQVIATYPTTPRPIGSASANIRDQRSEQMAQRPPLIPDRLTPGTAAQNYDVALNGPAGLTRQQFAALPGQTPLAQQSLLPQIAAPMPMPSAMRPRVQAPVQQAARPQAQRPQYAPMRIVVQGANRIPMPMPASARPQTLTAAQNYDRLVTASRGAPSLEDRVSGRAYERSGSGSISTI